MLLSLVASTPARAEVPARDGMRGLDVQAWSEIETATRDVGLPSNTAHGIASRRMRIAQSPLPNWAAGLAGKPTADEDGGKPAAAPAANDAKPAATSQTAPGAPDAPAASADTPTPADATAAAAAAAAAAVADIPAQIEPLLQPVKRIVSVLEDLTKTVERVKERDEELSATRREIDKIPSEAKKAIDAIRPRLADLKSQIEKLGPAPKPEDPPEAATVAAERARLNAAVTQLDGAVKSAELTQEKARQLVQYVQELRQGIFTRQLLRRTKHSPLKSELWKTSASEVPKAVQEVSTIARSWWLSASDRWVEIAAIVIVSLIIYFGFRHLRRKLVRARLDRPITGSPTFFERTAAAGWIAPAIAIPPMAAAVFLYVGLESNGLLYLQTARFAELALTALLIFFATSALSRAILQPGRGEWRLLDVSDSAARKLHLITRAVTAVFAINLVLRDVVRMLYLPFQLNIAIAFISSLLFAALLFALARTRLEPRTEIPGVVVSRWRPLWLKLPLMAVAALIAGAALLGYVAFARYISSQVVLSGTAIVAIILGHLAIRAIAGDASAEGGSVARRLLNGRLGLDDSQQRQMDGALLIVLNILLAFAAVPLMLFVWGFSTPEIAALISSALFGFDIGGVRISPTRILIAMGLFVALIFTTRLVQRWLSGTLLQPSRIDPGLANSIHTGVGYAGYAVATLIAVSYGGLDITNLAIVAGALSVGIGFGLQSIVNNFVSGLILLVERPIKVGDWISVGAFEGHVRRISVRSTEIETFDRSSVIVPNSELISGTVKNRTHRNALGRVDVAVGVAYKEDPAAVRDLLEKVVSESPLILKFPAPVISFDNFGASSLDFTVRAFVADVNKSLSTATDIRLRIFKAMQENGIEIPYPQTDVHLRDLDLVKAIVARAAEDRARKQAGDSDPRTTGEDERDGVASGRPAMT
ncbi:MAG: mechanosensitive ion channel family protein [Hyphomicrobiaceae bacterium]|nr:mechanosensitive ion channel family protein [Hyphomicrobiaceae bacterium]